MRRLTPREYVMLGALGLLGLAALYFLESDALGPGGASRQGDDPLPDARPEVLLARLSLPPEGYDPQGRNLFEYGPPPRNRVAAPRPPVRPERRKPPPKVVKQAPPAQPVPTRPKPPRPSFTYLGLMGPKENKIAVFEEGDEILPLAQVGDVVQQHFRLLEFKYESVILGYTDEQFEGQTTELAFKGAKTAKTGRRGAKR